MKRHRFLALLASCALSAAVLPAAAQDYPSKPIRIIVPLAAGGGTDVLARVVAQKLSDKFNQPAPLVVNKALYGKLPYEPEQFVLIGIVSLQDIMLAVNPNVPARNLQELIAYAKANPGDLPFEGSRAQMEAFIREETQRWGSLIKTVGITAQ